MKKTLKLLNAFLISGLILTNISCSDDDPEESCLQSDKNVESCEASDLTICCDDNAVCYYLYKDKKYAPANINDENDPELVKLANACKTTTSQMKSFSLQLDVVTKQMLNEIRLSAICD